VPTVTVLLCVRNGAATLERQLAALAAQDTPDDWELVLVDNGSTDATADIAARWEARLPVLRVVDEPRPGANRARNRGMRAARGDVVVCCDADDEVTPTWLRAMTQGLARYDVVGGRLDADRLNGPFTPTAGVIQRDELPSVFGWSYAVGASFGFRRRVFDEVGGFDPAFTLGSDEVDFCLRAQYAGATIGFVPDAVVHYRVKDSARAVVRQRFSYGRGHQVLVAKHARMGRIESRPIQRWMVITVSATKLLGRSSELLDRRARLQYVAAVAYLGGRATELLREAVTPR
jgi:glycosyltransferase involved in cell wall biosynthesis